MGCCQAVKNTHIPEENSSTKQNNEPLDLGVKIHKANFVQERKGILDENYFMKGKLGEGSYGLVREAVDKRTGVKRAIKTINIKGLHDQIDEIRREVEILKSLDHPNIIKVYEVIEDSKHLHIVTDLCLGGELFDHIIQAKYFSENLAARYMEQLLSAVCYCHKHGIVHRDLKPENLLLMNDSEDSPLKVIDFGTSRRFSIDSPMRKFTGTVYYIAPEVLKNNYNEKCDVWSCGVILYIMLCGKPPFNAQKDTEIYRRIRKQMVSFKGQEWTHVSRQAKMFIMKLLHKNPLYRLSAEEAYMSKWIQERSYTSQSDNLIAKNSLRQISTFKAERRLQQAALCYISSHLTSAQEIEELRRAFISIDKNGDGTLSREELAAGFEASDIDLNDLDNLIQKCDVDGNGSIDYSEFLTFAIDWKKQLNEEKLLYAFRAFDKDGNGKIDINELKETLGGDEQVEESVWLSMIAEIDKNGDGEIDLKEFMNMMLQEVENIEK